MSKFRLAAFLHIPRTRCIFEEKKFDLDRSSSSSCGSSSPYLQWHLDSSKMWTDNAIKYTCIHPGNLTAPADSGQEDSECWLLTWQQAPKFYTPHFFTFLKNFHLRDFLGTKTKLNSSSAKAIKAGDERWQVFFLFLSSRCFHRRIRSFFCWASVCELKEGPTRQVMCNNSTATYSLQLVIMEIIALTKLFHFRYTEYLLYHVISNIYVYVCECVFKSRYLKLLCTGDNWCTIKVESGVEWMKLWNELVFRCRQLHSWSI